MVVPWNLISTVRDFPGCSLSYHLTGSLWHWVDVYSHALFFSTMTTGTWVEGQRECEARRERSYSRQRMQPRTDSDSNPRSEQQVNVICFLFIIIIIKVWGHILLTQRVILKVKLNNEYISNKYNNFQCACTVLHISKFIILHTI